ncbi:tetratricopeptide repeat protein [Pseudovibrio exalbescens]|uniref:Tetratricopeptide repeat protein n=1 Tax=Pseudovibrio exalbescens TaxID=197461 RepID=A0A1U7JKS3_9HYPH|nr:tetratricopeptide repeat protein [Pseudovibrio exalbescens]OKL45294.1 hypothetical protein A3843_02855 [Pseudovibrio exalbescens]
MLAGSEPTAKKSLSDRCDGLAFRCVFARVFCAVALSVFALFAGYTPAFAVGEPATVTATQEDGFARLVINFPERTLLPDYDALVTAGVLRIAFPDGIDTNIDEVPALLSDYISVARRDPDGAALRFALKQPVNVNSMEAGEKLFVDLLPRSWQGMPPPLPEDVVADLAKRAEAAMRRLREIERDQKQKEVEQAQVDLRVGEHPTFTRLVFDWSVPFDSAFVRRNDRVEVQFDRKAELNLARMLIDPPVGVLGARSELRDAGLFVELAIDPAADVRAFREGSSYVVDVTPVETTPSTAQNSLLDEVEDVYVDPILKQVEGEERVVSLGTREEDAGSQPSEAPVERVQTPEQKPEGVETPEVAPTAADTASDAEPAETVRSAELGQVDDPIAAVLAQADEVTLAARAFGLPEEPLVQLSAPLKAEEEARIALTDAPLRAQPNLPEAKPGTTKQPVDDLVPGAQNRERRPKEKPELSDRGSAAEDVEPAPSKVDNTPSAPVAADPQQPTPNTDGSDSGLSTPEKVTTPETGDQPETETRPDSQSSAPGANSEISPDMRGTVSDEGEAPAKPVRSTAPQNEDGLPRVIPINSRTTVTEQPRQQARPSNPEAVPPEAQKTPAPLISVEVRRVGDAAQVHLPFGKNVSAAVFRRGRQHWMVFDSAVPIDDRALRAALEPFATDLSNEDHKTYQLVRMRLRRAVLASASAGSDRWILHVGPSISEPSQPLKVERNVQGDGAAVLRVALGRGGRIHALKDPDVGDTIYAVTAPGPARGVIKPHRYSQLQFLQSIHGIAVTLFADGVSVEVNGEDVVVSRDDGLAVSSEDLWRTLEKGAPLKDPTQPGLIEFANFTTPNKVEFRDKLRKFEAAVAMAEPDKMKGPRLDMARFYLAHGFAEEALGLLELAKDQNPTVATDATFNVMMGAAQMMANRPEQAKAYLDSQELVRSPDAAVWKTLADVALEDWSSTLRHLTEAGKVIDSYPDEIQVDFNLAAAKAHVELEDFGSAASYLAQVEPSSVSDEQAARYDLLRGRIADASGRTKEAMDAFEFVMDHSEGPEAAEATYRHIALRYRDGYLSEQDAIDELADLSTTWRGDETELRTLDLLAKLQAKEGDYRQAFKAMHQAVLSNPDSNLTRSLQTQMGDVFTDLFLREGADKLDAIDALAIFYDFRELLPVGHEGDQMVRYMADRMIDLDLLDQAARVLRHQIDHRLKGAAKAQIAADLSVVYLLDRRPEEALRVLSQTRQAQLPTTLQRQRNLVEARALTESGRPDLALELVRNMSGVDVDRLRADTLWAAKSWQKAAEQVERMHAGRWADAFPLDGQEQTDILRAAIGYSLAGDSLGLDRLRQKYSEKMSEGPNAAAFEVVTRPIDERGVEFLDVSRSIAATDSLDAFLDEYRAQYLTAGGPESPRPTRAEESAL